MPLIPRSSSLCLDGAVLKKYWTTSSRLQTATVGGEGRRLWWEMSKTEEKYFPSNLEPPSDPWRHLLQIVGYESVEESALRPFLTHDRDGSEEYASSEQTDSIRSETRLDRSSNI